MKVPGPCCGWSGGGGASLLGLVVTVQWNRRASVPPCATPSTAGVSRPAAASCDCAMTMARDWSSSSPARLKPEAKISKPVESTSASSTKATTISTSVNPASRRRGCAIRLVIDRHPPGDPVHVHEILALAGGHRDPPAGRAAVGIEADRAYALARDFGLRGVELEIHARRQLSRCRVADVELAGFEVDREERVLARRDRERLRLAQPRG